MKRAPTSSSFPTDPEAIAAAIARAPERIADPGAPYDPNDPEAVQTFWDKGEVRYPGQRGPGTKARKVLLSVRYSPEVVAYFKATGRGWQKRMDDALKNWVAEHPPK